MNIATWKEANDDVSGTRREEEAEASSGKAVISKLPPSSSSSSSWVRSKDPRIVRVSRAFGGKDRHSKVCTLRGLRDRRVRLSVPTAIQLYDLQERLGVDQPSKVVDWLLDAAKEEIDELPPLPISPENFSLMHHHRHHQPFLNLNPGLGTGPDPGQLGFKIDEGSAPAKGRYDEDEEERSHEEENEERRKTDVVLSNNTGEMFTKLVQQQHQHAGSYGSYYNLDHAHHSGFQTEQHHLQNHNLVPFPSQILVCPTTATSAATIQPLFPSPVEMMDPRQMVGQFQASGSSQNMSALYSLIHAGNNGGAHNFRMPVHFNRAYTGNANATDGTMSRILGSESSTSGGSDRPN